jgi:hypothetical protein
LLRKTRILTRFFKIKINCFNKKTTDEFTHSTPPTLGKICIFVQEVISGIPSSTLLVVLILKQNLVLYSYLEVKIEKYLQGVVFGDMANSVWILHSVPKYPPHPNETYGYPDTGHK